MVIQWDEPQELSGLVTVISHLVFFKRELFSIEQAVAHNITHLRLIKIQAELIFLTASSPRGPRITMTIFDITASCKAVEE